MTAIEDIVCHTQIPRGGDMSYRATQGSIRVSQVVEGMRGHHRQELYCGFHRDADLGWANLDNFSGSEA